MQSSRESMGTTAMSRSTRQAVPSSNTTRVLRAHAKRTVEDKENQSVKLLKKSDGTKASTISSTRIPFGNRYNTTHNAVNGKVSKRLMTKKPIDTNLLSRHETVDNTVVRPCDPSESAAMAFRQLVAEEDTGYLKLRQEINATDFDQEDMIDERTCADIVNTIIMNLLSMEREADSFGRSRYLPTEHCLQNQPEITPQNRATLVNWIVLIHSRLPCVGESLELTVNIIDRYLSKVRVPLKKLQLVGAVAFFIAAKYEDIQYPILNDLVVLLDDPDVQPEEFLAMERNILREINFDLGVPYRLTFLRRINRAESFDFQTRTLAKYFLEISLLNVDFNRFTPSKMSAAALYLARKLLQKGDWDADLRYYGCYAEKDLLECSEVLVEQCKVVDGNNAIAKRYASKDNLRASQFVDRYFSIKRN